MRTTAVLGLLLSVIGLVVLVLWSPWVGGGGRGTGAGMESRASLDAASSDDLASLRAEVQSLREELQRLQREQPLHVESGDRAPATVSAASSPGSVQDDRWYLDQYALSFVEEEQGSEFFRLAVEARLAALQAPVCGMLRDTTRVVPLRQSLARMLRKKRFQGTPEVNDALLFCVPAPSPVALALEALRSLAVTGDMGTLASLEQRIFNLAGKELQDACLDTLQKLSGERWNASLLRMFPRAPDNDWKSALIRRMDQSDLESALQIFIQSSTQDQPVRLAAAVRIGEYPAEEFRAFVQQWLGFETDEQVREALGASSRQQSEIPGWHALQATGEPNANRTSDDPKAWAPRGPESGIQWLELSYGTAMTADRVVIHETCTPGALKEVLVRPAGGEWQSVFRADQTPPSHPLQVEFAAVASVSAVKLILDTDRTRGWNEIDAVQLLGPGGSQWAKSARASSTYGGGQGVQLTIPGFFVR